MQSVEWEKWTSRTSQCNGFPRVKKPIELYLLSKLKKEGSVSKNEINIVPWNVTKLRIREY